MSHAPDYYTIYIQPSFLYLVPRYTTPLTTSRQYEEKDHEMPVCNEHKGVVSKKAARRICNAINWMYLASKRKTIYQKSTNRSFYYKLGFATLTLPTTKHKLTDHYVKEKMLHPWLRYMSKYHNMRNYIWKAEVQENGNIHFHLIIDAFVHHTELRKTWNRQCERAGLIDEFEKDHGHRNPNSTDIHAIVHIRKLIHYIHKYMSKSEEGKRAIKGRLWGCNRALSAKNRCTVELYPQHSNELRQITDNYDFKHVPTDFNHLYVIKPEALRPALRGRLRASLDDHLFYLRTPLERTELLNFTIA